MEQAKDFEQINTDKITVVIPNYNGEKYLNDCLKALYAQEKCPVPIHVLVVDNGSADGSVEAAKELFPETEWICLKENTGFCHAVNVGIEHTDAPYVILLNNDTKVGPHFVKALYEAICKDEKIFSVSSKMLMWDDPKLLDDAGDMYCALGWGLARGKGKPAKEFNRPAEIFSACAGAAIYRRSVFDEIGLFDELHFAYVEDLDIGYRARIYGYKNMYEPKAAVLHYGSASTGSRYNDFKVEHAAANNVYVVAKNMPLGQLLLNLPFLLPGYAVKFAFFCKKKMGFLYLKGVCKGLRRSFSKEGRSHHVPYQRDHLKNYADIQLRLLAGLVELLNR